MLSTHSATYMCCRMLYYKKPSHFCTHLSQTNRIQENLLYETMIRTFLWNLLHKDLTQQIFLLGRQSRAEKLWRKDRSKVDTIRGVMFIYQYLCCKQYSDRKCQKCRVQSINSSNVTKIIFSLSSSRPNRHIYFQVLC
jgi:hypothetical protein